MSGQSVLATISETDYAFLLHRACSKGIVSATNLLSTGMSSATSNYIAHSEPTREPVVFSDTTRQNFRRVHDISGQAATVTSKTTEMIDKAVEKLVDQITGQGSSSSSAVALPSRDTGGLSPSNFTSSSPGPPSPPSASHCKVAIFLDLVILLRRPSTIESLCIER